MNRFLLFLLSATSIFSRFEVRYKRQEISNDLEYEAFSLRFNRSLISFLQKESFVEPDDIIIIDDKRLDFKTAGDPFKRIIRDFIRYGIANSLFKKTTFGQIFSYKFGQIFSYKNDTYIIILDPIAFNLSENTELILTVSVFNKKTVCIWLSSALENLIETMYDQMKYLQEMD